MVELCGSAITTLQDMDPERTVKDFTAIYPTLPSTVNVHITSTNADEGIEIKDVTPNVPGRPRRHTLTDAMAGISKVLVVDDAPSNRKMVVRLLRGTECQCLQAENGQEAVDIIQKSLTQVNNDGTASGPIDLILMDAEMPILKGPAATRRIRELGFVDTMIIGVTGNVLPEDIKLFLDHGADAVVSKPLLTKNLSDVILSLKSSRDRNSKISDAATAEIMS